MSKIQTVAELIAELQEFADQYGEDSPVRVASQPSYPLANAVTGVTHFAVDGTDTPENDDEDTDDPRRHTVWITVDGVGGYDGESPYAPRWVFGE
jgi:hypothetical protein